MMESFVAWNGSVYAGRPPQNWYLAQDNRWWPKEATSSLDRQWLIGEGSLSGTLEMTQDGLHCVIERESGPDSIFLAFDSILRVSRTTNTFGSGGVRVQTTSQTFEWSVGQDQDDLADVINQHKDRLKG